MGVEERLKGENGKMKNNLEQTEIEAPYELPEGWKWCRLGDVAKYINGRAFKPKEWEKEGKPIIRIQNLTNSSNSVNRSTKIFEDKYLITKNDLLYAWSASLGAYLWSGEDGWLNQHIFKVIPNDNVDKMYLYHGLVHITENLYAKAHGSGMVHVTLKPFLNTQIPLPPTLDEQQRIVNRIESMFAKLDEAKEKAQNVVDGFEPRKAAILHKAFTGQLRIDNEELAIEDWEEKKLGDIVNGFKYGVSDKCDYKNDGIPVLRIPNVGDGTIDFTDLKYSERNNIEENYIVKENDILIIRSNGSRELVGKSALYNNTDKQFSYGSFLIKITPSEVVNPKYLVTFLNSDDARNQMFNKAKSSSGIHNINTKELSEIKLKLPPLNYQLSIVNFLDTVLEKESRAKEAAQTVLEQIALLKKSILARAFRGEL